MQENHKDYVLSLLESGLSLMPITEGLKSPHYACLDKNKKHNLLSQKATLDEVKNWIDRKVTSWAIAGGTVSGNLVTLDFDEKHYPGLYDLWYERLSENQKAYIGKCYISKTRNNGAHVRYRTETSQPTIKLARRIEWNEKTKKEEIVTTAETKAEGGYALIPPSIGYTTTQGNLLNLPIIPDEIHEELIDVLRTFNEINDEPLDKNELKPIQKPSNRPGDRFNELATWSEILVPHGWVEESNNHWRRPGKNTGEGISATTNYDNRPMFYVFSSSADPFRENKGYSKFHTFALLNHGGNFKEASKAVAKLYPGEKKENDEKISQADMLLNDVLSREDVVLFHDEQGDGFISLEIEGHREVRLCKSKAIRNWISYEIYSTQNKAPGGETMRSILGVLEGKAQFEGPEIKLENRVAWHNENLLYDLADKDWQAIEINKDGWKIIGNPPILFKRYSHHNSQVIPIINGDVSLFLKYVNVVNPQHNLLLLVYLISCFIPGFPHVMLVIFGAQGSSKSTLAKLLRQVVDPSLIDVASFPHSHKELVQALAHHHFLFFDNVSYISEEQSDTLCKAITGGGHVKRELYENDEDVIYNFMRSIGINGINLVTTRSDLLERSLLLELERIDPKDRKPEKEINENFQQDLPKILGGTFDVISKAIKIHPTIKLDSHPRMADWAIWGCAIAEALGYHKEEFLNAYESNVNRQAEMLLNENIVATTLFSFMSDRKEWKGTATELLGLLYSKTPLDYFEKREKYWPKSAGSLSKRLNELSTYLKQMGILIDISTTGRERFIHIVNIPKPSDDADDTSGTFNEDTAPINPLF